jgi:predicted adenine nucleotide alpha hydrolase (AANH) superfamily ATPase
MNKVNYNALMEKVVAEINEGEKPTLLLHSCCAPCSSACLERIKDKLDTTVYYYNPNMDTEEEFTLRAKEQQRLCESLGVKVVLEKYQESEFLDTVCGLETEREGGKRCEKCFYLRLKKTAEYAKEKGFDYFTTTLTVSPLKNAEMINRIGESIGKEVGVKYLPSDFKKGGGYLRSIGLSKEHNLYRQNYCGCKYSKINRKGALN